VREADHVARRSHGAEPVLDPRHRPERVEHLAEGHTGADLALRRGALSKGLEGGAVDAAVLADLERRAVEPERLHLPAQVLERAPGDATQPVGRQRGLELLDLGGQGGRRLVSPGLGAGSRGQVAPRSPQSLGHERQPATVRLLSEAAPELPVQLGQRLRVPGQP